MKKGKFYSRIFIIILILLGTQLLFSQTRVRVPIKIPDIPGYITLKCDFHIHTVFSDGTVWPHIRAEEAWREGLDAIAITDHIEYQPHKEDLPKNLNRSYEIARPHGDALQVIVIRGSEITREMPPGHLNAIFLKDVEPLDTENWRDAVKAAYQQGAFIFWNHPGWRGQQPDGVARWYPEHTELYEKGMLHGIEVVNGRSYYPEAHQWCLEKNLTMLSNSDIHNPLNLDYLVHQGDHRPITLVFVKEKTSEAIKEALFNQRTAVYSGNLLIGREKFLKPIFYQSIRMVNPSLTIKGKQRIYLQIENKSDLNYKLIATQKFKEISTPDSLTLLAGKIVLLDISSKSKTLSGKKKFKLPFIVKNLLVAPNKGMSIELPVEITFIPPKNK